LEYNFPLTTQNIVVGFHIDRDVPEGWWGGLQEKPCEFICYLRRIREPSLSMLEAMHPLQRLQKRIVMRKYHWRGLEMSPDLKPVSRK
jgi:hypothetical protein